MNDMKIFVKNEKELEGLCKSLESTAKMKKWNLGLQNVLLKKKKNNSRNNGRKNYQIRKAPEYLNKEKIRKTWGYKKSIPSNKRR